jgi:type II secretory pathway component PulF
MANFQYTGRDSSGAVTTGSLSAENRRDALRVLGVRGIKVSGLTENGSSGKQVAKEGQQAKSANEASKRNPISFSFSVHGNTTPKHREMMPFLEALFDLVGSGLSAGEAVRLLSVRLKDPTLKVLCQGLWEYISEGAPLSRAMAAYPAVFDPSTINLIAAGEATGSLKDTLARLISHLQEQRELRRDLLSSMVYPLFMMFVSGCVILFFLFFLLPRMQTLLSSLGGKLPISTQILVGLSSFVLHYGIFLAIAAVFFGVSFWRWRTSDAGRAVTDAWILKLPFAGSLACSQTVLAISQTLSVLLENGITTAEALKMTERQISNTVHRAAFTEATARVLEGESLSIALGRMQCFPDLVLDRLAVGENTGNMVPSLKDIANNYRKSLSREMHRITRVLTSAMMLGVFIFVGFLAFAIVSAVFQLSASFKM